VDFLSRCFLKDAEGKWFAAVKMGRIVVKTGWSRHYYSTTARALAYVKGLLLGLRYDFSSHPVLRGLMNLLLTISDDLVPIFAKTLYEMEFELHCEREHPISLQTWECLALRYELPVGVLRELAEECSHLQLGGELGHPAWKRVLEVDL
jgi:hypothetical protein